MKKKDRVVVLFSKEARHNLMLSINDTFDHKITPNKAMRFLKRFNLEGVLDGACILDAFKHEDTEGVEDLVVLTADRLFEFTAVGGVRGAVLTANYPLSFTNHTFGELRKYADEKHLNRRYTFELTYWDDDELTYTVNFGAPECDVVDDKVLIRRKHRSLFGEVNVEVYRY